MSVSCGLLTCTRVSCRPNLQACNKLESKELSHVSDMDGKTEDCICVGMIAWLSCSLCYFSKLFIVLDFACLRDCC